MSHNSFISFPEQTIIAEASMERHHGLGLWPPPSNDEKDPLRWPRRVKLLALMSMALFNFVANFSGSGLSVATVLLERQFQKTLQEVNALMTFNFLLVGVGNMFWVPLSVKYGKRSIMLVSMALLFAFLAWTANIKTFTELLAARCLSGFASAAGESILPGVISDISFLHERGALMSIYVILISSGTAAGPLLAGFIIERSPGTWRDFVWLCAALAGFNLLAIFFFYPESSFIRPSVAGSQLPASIDPNDDASKEGMEHMARRIELSHRKVEEEQNQVKSVKVSFPHVWTSFLHCNHSVKLPKAFALPFMFLLCVPVLWTILVYGAALASQVIVTFAFPSLLLAPPYMFVESSVGLMQISAIIGFIIACYGGGYICDVITARLIIRNGGVFIPEKRLLSLVPGCLVQPAGCILIAFACDRKFHWAVIAIGFSMLSFDTVYAPNIVMTYLLDCYPAFAQEILVAVNVTKNLVAFLFLYVAVDWVNSRVGSKST